MPDQGGVPCRVDRPVESLQRETEHEEGGAQNHEGDEKAGRDERELHLRTGASALHPADRKAADDVLLEEEEHDRDRRREQDREAAKSDHGVCPNAPTILLRASDRVKP